MARPPKPPTPSSAGGEEASGIEVSRDGASGIAGLDDLVDAIRTLRTSDEVRSFLRDLCTRAELEALAHRWQTAVLVDEGVPYVEIAERVPTSTATVTRVAQWVRHGTGGYAVALGRVRR